MIEGRQAAKCLEPDLILLVPNLYLGTSMRAKLCLSNSGGERTGRPTIIVGKAKLCT